MKRIIFAVCLFLTLAFTTSAFAAGACVFTSRENINVLNAIQRKVIKLTCTGDGTIATYSFNPATYGVQGWYLYNVTTIPDGTHAPTNLYDITLLVNAEDIAGGLLADRSSTVAQTVVMTPSTLGLPITDDIITITIANETASPSTFVMLLRFTAN